MMSDEHDGILAVIFSRISNMARKEKIILGPSLISRCHALVFDLTFIECIDD